MQLPSIEEIEKTIKVPVARWQGNCYNIATAIVEAHLIPGYAVYGHYLGEVKPETLFYDRRQALGFVPHGWIVTEDENLIADPTRWVFCSEAPMLFHTRNPHPDYDEGGQKLRGSLRGSFPREWGPSKLVDWTPEVDALLRRLTGHVGPRWTIPQLLWIANLEYDWFEGHNLEAYDTLASINCGAFVPIDNYLRAQRTYAKGVS